MDLPGMHNLYFQLFAIHKNTELLVIAVSFAGVLVNLHGKMLAYGEKKCTQAHRFTPPALLFFPASATSVCSGEHHEKTTQILIPGLAFGLRSESMIESARKTHTHTEGYSKSFYSRRQPQWRHSSPDSGPGMRWEVRQAEMIRSNAHGWRRSHVIFNKLCHSVENNSIVTVLSVIFWLRYSVFLIYKLILHFASLFSVLFYDALLHFLQRRPQT